MSVEVISKATGAVHQVAGNDVALDAPSIVRLDIARTQVAAVDRQGSDLVVRLVDGGTVHVTNFYPAQATTTNELVLRENDGHLWVARGTGVPRFSLIDDLTDLTAAAGGGGSALALPATLLGGAAAAGGVVALASGGGSDATAAGSGTPDTGTGTGATPTPTPTPTPDTTPPTTPTATVRADGGAISGQGEAGATVTVRDAAGAVIGSTTVAADGSFAVPLAPARVDNERLTVTQSDAAGNVSPAATIQAPDLTAPATPVATIDAAGTSVSGQGEAGATVTVRDASGAVIGSTVVAADGSYSVPLTTPQANGGAVTVTQGDAAGNVSPPLSVTAPDVTAPAAPTVAIDGTGTVVSGTGEPGARVTISGAGGTALATAIVAADGSYSAPLSAPQVNGERVDASQSDAAGNGSGSASTTAPDLTAPVQPVATISADGTQVTGTGEAGATVSVVTAAGTVIGSATVAADGGFAVTLTPAQANGESLSVRESDAAGNQAPPLALTAPDLTAPAAPVAAIDPTGTTVTGSGEAGAAITIRDAAGNEVGTATVGANGSYAAVLTAPQIDSQALSVTQSDAAGNASPATPLTAPDLTAPAAPTLTVAADGASVSGSGEPGATVTVRDPVGTVIATATVAADGSYSAPLTVAQIDGEQLSARQGDVAGNLSPVATASAPDLAADAPPAAPSATVTGDGSAVTGVAGAGAAITLYDADGRVIATGTAAADGSYTVALTPARLDGETIRVTQADAVGAVSPPATAIAPDLTNPAAPTATLDATGTLVTGTAEAGATVTVRDAAGVALGSAVATSAGSYAVTLTPPQANGGTLAVTQADGANNVSPATSIAVPDTTAPAAPSALVAGDGLTVSGSGEVGATVTVRDAVGNPLGSATVAADGRYTITLTTPQGNGETVTVAQADGAGNPSPATAAVAPDFTAPLAPTATVAAGGTLVTGSGEAGATVTITAANGSVLGTGVVAGNGSYSVTLATPQIASEPLTAVQADASGNVSPATGFLAPDLTAPAAPAATLDATGSIVTGTGEIGATVTVRDAAGVVLGSATVTAQGYAITLTTPQIDSQSLSVTQSDAAGNASPATPLTAPDLTAPAAPTGSVAGDGLTLSGTGEAGATVVVRSPVGLEIGSATVAADGSYTVQLATRQADGEVLTVRQSDAAGNVSPVISAVAPDLNPATLPPPPLAEVAPDGTAVAGRGVGAATITVYDAAGTVIATGTAAADGSYSVTLSPARVDHETLYVTQTDIVGASAPTQTIAPDLTAPAAPSATLDATGAIVTGSGEPGAAIVVRDVAGNPLGTAIVSSAGGYAVTLATAQTNGELLSVTQADPTGNVSPPIGLVAGDTTPPLAPVASVSGDGAFVNGSGEPGTMVMVRDAGGTLLGTATVATNGSFSVALTPAQLNGETVRVTLSDASGNVSPSVTAPAPDVTAPAAPGLAVNPDGTVVTGTGEPGAVVTIAAGTTPLGSATVAADGSYTVTLSAQQNNGGTLSATQADAAGNVSPAATVTAPDLIAPAAPTAGVSADGLFVTGTGEPGARITVTDATGSPLGVAVVTDAGSYSVTLTSPQANGERLIATQTDGGGNVSPPVAAFAPDITAPAAPTLIVAADGASAGGIAEAGASVTVTGPNFTATVTADANGVYSVAIDPARLDGETFTAVQTDAALNSSLPTSAQAPDLLALAPTATIAADGASITGTGEVGATVTVTAAGTATVLGTTTVAADGSYTIALTPAQVDGEPLTVSQTDVSNNVSPGIALTAPDLFAPPAPSATVSLDGTTVSGIAEAGATVTVTAPDGDVLGRATAAADGSYSVTLTPAQGNGELLAATASDGGGTSAATAVTAPDFTAPDAPSASVTGDGQFVIGAGEAGATVTVLAANGTPLGSGVVTATGSYAVQLATPQVNGELLTVRQTDAATNTSPTVQAAAPDLATTVALTASVTADGVAVTGTAAADAAIVVMLNGVTVGTGTADGTGAYSVTLTVPQRNGELLDVTQSVGGGTPSTPVLAIAPDLTAPAAPTASVIGGGTQVIGTGEAGARVSIRSAAGVEIGSAIVAVSGSYVAELTTPQRNGESLTAVQTDPASNPSPAVALVAPDITAPLAPTALAVSAAGTTLTGVGESGARVSVRSGTTLLGEATVANDGSFTVALTAAQLTGATLTVTQADPAGNVSPTASVIAPFDIQAFDNAANATIDLLPVVAAAPTPIGSVTYGALLSAGALNLQAEALGEANIRFTVAQGHNLAATFTYDSAISIGATSGYSVVVQRFDGTQWVAVNGASGGSLLELGLLNGDLTAAQTLAPGEYRAFVTYQSGLGVGAGVLGSLSVSGVDIDYTDVGGVRPVAVTGNVVSDAGPTGAVDVVAPGTTITQVTNGTTVTDVTANGTVVAGQWGTLVINLDGSYSYTPSTSATAIGHTDVFAYTLLDPSDGERETANLSITIGSGAISGPPVVTADVAIAPVTYQNVVEVTAPVASTSFTATPLVQLPLAPIAVGAHGEGTGAFVINPATKANITLSATSTSALSVAPTYTLTLTNTDTNATTTVRQLALLGGTASTSFALNDLPAGHYSYRLAADSTVSTSFGTNVTLGRTTTLLDSHVVVSPAAVEGNLLANDNAHSDFIAVRVGSGAAATTLTEVGETPVTLTGAHGTLTVDEVGHYVYQPSASLAYSTTDLSDTFTYQLVQPNGSVATTTLTVTIDVPGDNASAAVHYAIAPVQSIEPDVVSIDTTMIANDSHTVALDGHTATAATGADSSVATAQSLATYDLFEGQGDIGIVLSRYLDTQVSGSTTQTTTTDTTIAAAPAPVADPLDYLATPDDPTHHQSVVNHVV
ncbi:BapA/Bap/LapF family large adhesin [Sphingomonas kyungheensis]|uniref:BapA/Bap/LapF family large adhesin n=1 Tax=Sphingomonas kyungheensis TaxID=1069987 RepID=A0ABU8GYT2_9SPHN